MLPFVVLSISISGIIGILCVYSIKDFYNSNDSGRVNFLTTDSLNERFQESLTASIIVCIPMIIEAIFEWSFLKLVYDTYHWHIRNILLLNVFFPSIIMRACSIWYDEIEILILYSVCSSIQSIVQFSAILFYFRLAFSENIWTARHIDVLVLWFTVAVVCRLYFIMYPNSIGLDLFVAISLAGSYSLFGLLTALWSYDNKNNLKLWNLSGKYLCGAVYSTGLVVEVIITVVVIYGWNDENFDRNNNSSESVFRLDRADVLSYVKLGAVVYMVGICGRAARLDAISLHADTNSKRTFVRFISHEIRSPLNTIALGLDLLNTVINASTSLSPEEVDRINTIVEIKRSSDAAVKILNDLLTYDRIDKGHYRVDIKPVKAISYFNRCIKKYLDQSHLSDYNFIYELEDGECNSVMFEEYCHSLVYVNLDEIKFSLVIETLISNAVKFSNIYGNITFRIAFLDTCEKNESPRTNRPEIIPEESSKSLGSAAGQRMFSSGWQSFKKGCQLINEYTGGRMANIPSKNATVKNVLRFSVIDNGKGIAPNDLDKIFNQLVNFNVVHLSAHGDNIDSGLGLHISKYVVELHNGTIGCKSQGIGYGSEFFVDIPYEKKMFTDPAASIRSFLENVPSSSKSSPAKPSPDRSNISLNSRTLSNYKPMRRGSRSNYYITSSTASGNASHRASFMMLGNSNSEAIQIQHRRSSSSMIQLGAEIERFQQQYSTIQSFNHTSPVPPGRKMSSSFILLPNEPVDYMNHSLENRDMLSAVKHSIKTLSDDVWDNHNEEIIRSLDENLSILSSHDELDNFKKRLVVKGEIESKENDQLSMVQSFILSAKQTPTSIKQRETNRLLNDLNKDHEMDIQYDSIAAASVTIDDYPGGMARSQIGKNGLNVTLPQPIQTIAEQVSHNVLGVFTPTHYQRNRTKSAGTPRVMVLTSSIPQDMHIDTTAIVEEENTIKSKSVLENEPSKAVESKVLKRALVVDDSSLNRKMLSKSISKQGFVTTEACDGDEAVALVELIILSRTKAGLMKPKGLNNSKAGDANIPFVTRKRSSFLEQATFLTSWRNSSSSIKKHSRVQDSQTRHDTADNIQSVSCEDHSKSVVSSSNRWVPIILRNRRWSKFGSKELSIRGSFFENPSLRHSITNSIDEVDVGKLDESARKQNDDATHKDTENVAELALKIKPRSGSIVNPTASSTVFDVQLPTEIVNGNDLEVTSVRTTINVSQSIKRESSESLTSPFKQLKLSKETPFSPRRNSKEIMACEMQKVESIGTSLDMYQHHSTISTHLWTTQSGDPNLVSKESIQAALTASQTQSNSNDEKHSINDSSILTAGIPFPPTILSSSLSSKQFLTIQKSEEKVTNSVRNTEEDVVAVNQKLCSPPGNVSILMNSTASTVTPVEVLQEYDIILMDFVMERMNGPEAARKIRDMGYTGMIFGVTGNALPSDITYYLEQGADAVLTKPLDVNLFLTTFNEVKTRKEVTMIFRGQLI